MYARNSKNARIRADELLVRLALVDSRHRARALVLAGEVFSGTDRVEKAGQMLPIDTKLVLREGPRFVGRGGEKLAGALQALKIDVAGAIALDVGMSTGGFTDCLLQNGAQRVYGVDVGRGQAAERLRIDPRVILMERTNGRYRYDLPERVDIAAIDVSFISLLLVLPETIQHVRSGGQIIALVKPQFEAGRNRVGRAGLVRDPKVHAEVLAKVCLWMTRESPLRILGVRRSVLRGETGNQEFFIHARVSAPS